MAALKKEQNIKLRHWYSNKYQIVTAQRNILSLFAMLAMIVVVIAILFLKKFTESKSFEPYVIEIEDKTGIITVVENVNNTRLSADEAIKKFYLKSFLDVAEGYGFYTFAEDRRKLALFTNQKVFSQINRRISPRNEKSPSVLLGQSGDLKILIKSFLFLTPEVVNIRFAVINVGKLSKDFPSETHYITRIEFKFADMELKEQDRFINPLGFQVIKYNIDIDLIK